MNNEASFRVIPYFISQYLLFLALVISFTFPDKSTSRHIAEKRYCSPSTGEEWQPNYDPDYFYHITDVHITHYVKSSLDNFEKSLKNGVAYKAKAVLITGDLVDNYYIPYFPSEVLETKQIREDWVEYSKMAKKYLKYFNKIIESFGNHDIPRILSKKADNFFYKNYSMISQSHHNFIWPNETYDVFTDKVGNFTFAVLNPIFFPIPPLPFDYYVHAPSEYIDKVESIIDSIPNNETVILATHFQGPVWSEWYVPFEKSTATNRFFNSILQKKKVKILITGHNHGAGRMVMHYNDSVEVCASDLRFNLKSGLVTNDNDNVVYHWFSIDSPTQSFVTFPAPVEQTTSRTVCSVKKIRVISFRFNLTELDFLNRINNMYVMVDGCEVKLEPVRKLAGNEDCWLLEGEMDIISNGRHHLKLIGEEEEEFEFLFGPSAKINSTKELLYDDMMWTHRQWVGLIILIASFLFATFPVTCCCNRFFNGYWQWTNKIDNSGHKESLSKEPDHNNDLKYWLVSIFTGPLGIRSRLLKLPLFLRVLLFISVVASLFLPVFTFDVGGHYGYMFIFGYFLGQGSGVSMDRGGKYISRVYGAFELRYEEWCPFLGFYYFSTAVVPVILAASSLGLRPKNVKESPFQIIDFLTELGGLAGGFGIAFRSFVLLCERKCALLSPFILFPLFWLTILSLFFYIRKIQRGF